ncbi:reverse transcriptase domain-containing protein [Tanacetum coccineum]
MLGQNATILGQNAIGQNATIVGQNAMILGQNATIVGQNAIGQNAMIVGQNAMILGQNATIVGQNATSQNATIVGQNAMILGQNAINKLIGQSNILTNHLLKIDPDLFTYDIQGFKTYDEYAQELNNKTQGDKEPWSENRVQYQLYDHICEPYRFKNGKAKWPTCNSDIDGFCNGGELPGMVRVGSMTYFQDHKWYDGLVNGKLKDETLALNDCWWKVNTHEIAPFTRMENFRRGPYANIKTEWGNNPHLDTNHIFERDHEASNVGCNQEDQEHKDNPIPEPSHCKEQDGGTLPINEIDSNDISGKYLDLLERGCVRACVSIPWIRVCMHVLPALLDDDLCLRTAEIDVVQNDVALEINLDLLEERREQAAIREAMSKAKMEKYYNSKVRNTSFKPGDLVYRNNDASNAKDSGKLSPKWEGPYEVTEALGKGAYKLRDRHGKPLPRT